MLDPPGTHRNHQTETEVGQEPFPPCWIRLFSGDRDPHYSDWRDQIRLLAAEIAAATVAAWLNE